MATKSDVSDCIRMLGGSADNPVPVMLTENLTDWLVRKEVLEYLAGTNDDDFYPS